MVSFAPILSQLSCGHSICSTALFGILKLTAIGILCVYFYAKTRAEYAKTRAEYAKTRAEYAKTGAEYAKTRAEYAKTGRNMPKPGRNGRGFGVLAYSARFWHIPP